MVTDAGPGGPGGALVVGLVAGLGVAVPVGAVAVLLVEEALTRGRRAGLAAAVGVATVDGAYALLAVTAGAVAVELLEGRESVARWGAAAVLAIVAVRGLVRDRRAAVVSGGSVGSRGPRRRPGSHRSGPLGGAVRSADDDRGVGGGCPAPWRVGARFVAVTAVNPATALYFSVVVAGWSARLTTVQDRALFVVGALAASASWQVTLALVAAAMGARLPRAAGRVVGPAGHGLVLVLACLLAMSA